MPTLELEGVDLQYPGAVSKALSGLSVRLTPGIVGLVGANGAGKSSLLRLLLGVSEPTAGAIRIDGRTPEDYRRRCGIGFIPEQSTFPTYLTVGEFLTGLRSAVMRDGSGREHHDLAQSFGLAELDRRALGMLSLGQKRRVELAAALTSEPSVLLLDEPTNGLDPLATAALRDALVACDNGTRVIVISSHNLDELQRIASTVVMLDRGTLVGMWTGDDAREQAGTLEARFRSLVRNDAK